VERRTDEDDSNTNALRNAPGTQANGNLARLGDQHRAAPESPRKLDRIIGSLTDVDPPSSFHACCRAVPFDHAT